MDHLAGPPVPGGGHDGGASEQQQDYHSAATAATYPFYSQQIASQYHSQPSHAPFLPPSSHLPSQYQATPTPLQPPQFQGDPSSHPSEPLQKVLMWQSGVSCASSSQQILSNEQHQQQHQSLEPSTYHLAHRLPLSPPSTAPARDCASATRDMSALHVSNINSAGRSRASTTPVAVAPPANFALAATSSHYQSGDPPSLQPSSLPRSLHFHSVPQAIPGVSLSYPSSSPISRTIDLNPSRTAAQQAGLEYGLPRRAESSSSSSNFMQQQHPVSRQVVAYPSLSSSTDVSKNLRAADWDDTASPARSSHTRFKSASNVRGAPTEPFDGTPQKSMWDPHGRLATMESITSSQWSPVVNDMYRFVDPLRPTFEFTPSFEQGPPSPTKSASALQQQPIPTLSQSNRRVSSFSSIASGPMPSPPPTTSTQLPVTSAHLSQHYHHHYQSSAGSRPVMSNEYAHQPQYQYLHMQPTQVAPQLQMSFFEQQPSTADEDSECRRASTSTSISSAPLVSPQDLQTDRPNIVNQIPEHLAAAQLEDPMTQYLQDPHGSHAYKDYFHVPYETSPSTALQPLQRVDFGYPKSASPLPVIVPPSLLMSSSLEVPPLSRYPGQWEPPLDLPITQLERQTLPADLPSPISAVAPKEEVKRKRPSSRRDSASRAKPALSKPSAGQRSSSANATLRPAQERAYRRLSSPVLSVRPSDSGSADAFSDDDDDGEEDELADHTSTSRTQSGSAGLQHGSYTQATMAAPSASSAAFGSSRTYPSVYGSASSVPGSSTSVSTYTTPIGENQPIHPVPPPPDTSQLVRVVPNDEDDPDLGRPRRQKLRFADDWYTPEWVRGDAAKKEGFCDLCQPGKWLQLKNSAFWYHRQYTHGVSSVSGQPFSSPVSFRRSENDASTEALCHQCNEWVMYMSRKQNAAEEPSLRIPTNWFKHAHKCHFYVANRSKNDKPRSKRRKVSSSPDDDDS